MCDSTDSESEVVEERNSYSSLPIEDVIVDDSTGGDVDTNTLLSLHEVKSKIAKGELKVIERPGAKSSVWQSFHQVVDDKGIGCGFARCIKCSSFLRSDAKGGTSSLLRHMRMCKPDPASQTTKITQFIRRASSANSSNAKKLITNALVFFARRTYGLLTSSKAMGFGKLAKFLLKSGLNMDSCRWTLLFLIRQRSAAMWLWLLKN